MLNLRHLALIAVLSAAPIAANAATTGPVDAAWAGPECTKVSVGGKTYAIEAGFGKNAVGRAAYVISLYAAATVMRAFGVTPPSYTVSIPADLVPPYPAPNSIMCTGVWFPNAILINP